MTLLFFLILVLFTFVTFSCIFLFHWIKVTAQIKTTLVTLTAINVDNAVDEFFRKAVIIAEDQFRGSQLDPDEKAPAIIQRACGIAADVLLQHGLNPREYNLSGLVGIARVREGFDNLK